MSAAELIDRIYATGHVEAEDGSLRGAFPSGMPRKHATELGAIVRDHGLTRTLEVGLAYGLSTLTICSVHEQRGAGQHIAIDPAQAKRYGSIGLLNIRRAGLEHRLRHVAARSDVALPRLRDEGVRIDFALIDGRHVFDTALLDFYYADLMLDVGGIVMFHDTWLPSQAQVVAYVRRNRAYELIGEGDGSIAVLRKVDEDDRAWFFHREFALDRRTLRARVRLAVGKRLGLVPPLVSDGRVR